MAGCSEDAKDDTCNVCRDEHEMHPEHVVDDHGGETAVEWSSEAWVSLVVTREASAGVEDGRLAAEP